MFNSTIFSFFITITFILLIIDNAKYLKLLDIPNQRSSHTLPKPRGAGIAIYFSTILTITIFQYNFFINNIIFFISLSIIFFIGLVDDITNIKPKIKFIFIILATIILFFYTDLKITSLGIWFNKDLSMPTFFSLLFTVFAVVGYTNALNLIDGLDGLAAGISLIIFSSFLYLGFKYNDDFIIIISYINISSLIAFLLFNWYPSKIFLGDSGSLLIGFSIAILAIKLIQHINTMSILFLAALPILDTIIVMSRRLQRHKSPFIADKSHIHHRILNWKTKVDYSVLLLVLIQLSFSLLGIITIDKSNIINLFIYIIVLKIAFYVFDERKTPRGKVLVKTHYTLSNFLINFKFKYILMIVIIVLSLILKIYTH